MSRRWFYRANFIVAGFLGCAWVAGCATSPTGRKQLMLVSPEQMEQIGAEAFSQLKQQTPIDRNAAVNSYVQCVAGAITSMAKGETQEWEVVVFEGKQVNAFALPGGKIGVYTGILPVAKTEGQLGAILGHEVGHVIALHSAERASEQLGTSAALAGIGAFTPGTTEGKLLLGALGLGAQVGITLPHSRTQESEADILGLELMAQAGFDPRQSVELWRNMSEAAGGQDPPEWLSTHPKEQSRIRDLKAKLPRALKTYQAAVKAGRRPQCERPHPATLAGARESGH